MEAETTRTHRMKGIVRMDASQLARFEPKIKVDPTGCWLWNAAISTAGYGTFTIDGRKVGAHVVSYEHHVGPVPDGLWLDHLCRTRCCVNPAHLEAVTPRENTLRSPVAPAAINARKTHCKRGHELTDDNVYVNKGRKPGDVWRSCRTCVLDRKRVAA